MRRAAAALALALGLLALSPARASAEDPHCIQHGTKHAYLCYYHQPGTGGGVYATLLLFENWYYWHPLSGDLVVDETYVHSSAPGYAGAHRMIHFSDLGQVTDQAWLANFPHNTGPPAGSTPAEQRSAMDFQYAMNADQIGHSF